jgi:glucose-1-phosphate adenylyltransferase
VLILSGDQLYRMDYRQMLNTHTRAKAACTISTIPVNADAARGFGIMQLEDTGRVKGFVEKPKTDQALASVRTPADWIDQHGIQSNGREYLASMGIYLFDRDLLVSLLESTDHDDFGRDIFPMVIKDHHVQTHLFDGYWEDIGTIKAFYDANLALAKPNPPFTFADPRAPVYTRPRFLPSTRFGSCSVNESLVADGCFVGSGSSLDNSVIGLRCRVGSNVSISNSVIMGADYYDDQNSADPPPRTGIEDNVVIDRALIDKNVHVGANARIVASEAPKGDGDYGPVSVRDGIVVIPKRAVIPEGWKF